MNVLDTAGAAGGAYLGFKYGPTLVPRIKVHPVLAAAAGALALFYLVRALRQDA